MYNDIIYVIPAEAGIQEKKLDYPVTRYPPGNEPGDDNYIVIAISPVGEEAIS